MAAFPSSLLPSSMLPETTADRSGVPPELQNLEQNQMIGNTGLFAALLSQLAPALPAEAFADAPELADTAPLAMQLDDAALPLAGKPLPLALAETPVEAEALTLALSYEIPAQAPAATLTPAPIGDRVLALPVMPQPAMPQAVLNSVRDFPPDAAMRGRSVPTRTDGPLPVPEPVRPGNPMREPTPLLALDDVAELVDFDISEPVLRTPTPATPSATISVAGPNVPPAMATTANAATSPPPSLVLERPVADPAWGDEIGQRMIWMTENGVGRAQLRLNPPELGPVEIRLSIANDDARVAFNVQHAATREALENALPRLREMFASQGLNLADANVSQQSPQGQQQAGQTDTGEREGTREQRLDTSGSAAALDEAPPPDLTASVVEGLIDAYA